MRNEKLAEALEAMKKKELGTGVLYTPSTGCYCAVGAMLAHRQFDLVLAGAQTFGDIDDALDQPRGTVSEITNENDGFIGSNEARHTHMLDWSKG